MVKKISQNLELEKVIAEINKGLQADGGAIKLLSFENGILTVSFQGACLGCPMAAITYKEFVEKEIKNKVKEVKEVKLGK